MSGLLGNTADFDAENMWKILVISVVAIIFVFGVTPTDHLKDAAISLAITIILLLILTRLVSRQKREVIQMKNRRGNLPPNPLVLLAMFIIYSFYESLRYGGQ